MAERTIGLELEFLAIQLENGLAATRSHIKSIWREWAEEPHIELYIDYATREPAGVYYKMDDGRSFLINTDAGICLVEFSFLPFSTLNEAHIFLQKCVAEYLHVAKKHGIGLMAYGLQPKTPWFYPDLKSEKQWYRTFGRLPYFQTWHNQFHTIAAEQPCIGVSYEELIPSVNTLNALGGVTVALFANSSVGEWKVGDYHEEREYRWDRLVQGFGDEVTRITGIPKKPFVSFRDYLEYNWGALLPSVLRGKAMHIVEPLRLISEYLRTENARSFNVADSTPSEVSPDISDVNMLNMYIWIQARPRLFYTEETKLDDLLRAFDDNTIDEFTVNRISNLYVENRNIAGQPWNEIMTAPAYCLGIIENMDKAIALVDSKPWKYWIHLREKTIKDSMNVEEVWPFAEQIIQIAKEGLKKRGLDEESYLEPLFERVRMHESPAIKAVREFESFGMDAFIESRLIRI